MALIRTSALGSKPKVGNSECIYRMLMRFLVRAAVQAKCAVIIALCILGGINLTRLGLAIVNCAAEYWTRFLFVLSILLQGPEGHRHRDQCSGMKCALVEWN